MGSELRKKKRTPAQAAKKDISKGAEPLKASPAPSASRQGRTFRQAWRKTAGELSEEEQRKAVLQVRREGSPAAGCRLAGHACRAPRPQGVTPCPQPPHVQLPTLGAPPFLRMQALEVFRQLPPASSYAQHRIRVLEKALALLDKATRCDCAA